MQEQVSCYSAGDKNESLNVGEQKRREYLHADSLVFCQAKPEGNLLVT